MQQPLTVANPDMEVRSSGSVESVVLYCSARLISGLGFVTAHYKFNEKL